MDLNTILIILGIVALIALIVHGLWSNRREKSKYFQKANKFNRTSPPHSAQPHDAQTYDAPSSYEKQSTPTQMEMPLTDVKPTAYQPTAAAPQPATERVEYVDDRDSGKTIDDIKITLPGNTPPVYDMGHHRAELAVKPMQAHYDMPMPTNHAATAPKSAPNNVAEMTIEQLESHSQQAGFEGINSSSQALREQLAEMSTEEPHNDYAVSFNEPKAVQASKPKQTSGYIQLYLIPEYQEEFNGLQLVQALENLGFIFGDRDMYHRHLDLSVASPVLFSVANFEREGRFNPEAQHDFSTSGIVLFMQLPSPGSNLANLRMMIRTARTLAQELQGLILTEEQEIFNDAAELDYLARV